MSDATNLSFSIDPSGAKTGSAQVVRSLEDIKSKARESANQFGAFEAAMKQAAAVGVRSLQYLGAGFAGMKIASLIKQTVELGARYQELGIGLARVAANVGASAAQVSALESALRKTGISAIQSRQSIMSMIQANMDLTQATKLARVAQDAAVVGQLNSSDALQRIIYGLQTAQPEMLRTLGLTVNFEQAYAKLAAQLKVTQNDLTNEQKAQARLNAVMEAGGKITGLYEASMTSASKQMRSSTRYVEDLQVKLGGLFQPAYTVAVEKYTKALKLMAENTGDVVVGIAAIALAFSSKKIVETLSRGATAAREFAKSMTMEGRQSVVDRAAKASDEAFAALKLTKATVTLAEAERAEAAQNMKSAKTAVEKANAVRALAAAEDKLTMALKGQQAAQLQLNAANTATSKAIDMMSIKARMATGVFTAFKGALGFFGGPLGVAITAVGFAATKWAMATSTATKALEENSDALSPYMDRLEAARRKVEGLSEAQRKSAAEDAKIRLAALKTDIATQRGEMGLVNGGGFFGGLKSAKALGAMGPEGDQALRNAMAAFKKTGDVDAYRASVMGVFKAYGSLNAEQKALYDAMIKQADVYQSTTQLAKDLATGLPALTTAVGKAASAFAFSEVQGQAFLDMVRGSTDATTKRTLAEKYGVKTAEDYAAAAKGAGKSLSEFVKDLSSSNPSIKAHSEILLQTAKTTRLSEEGYAKLAGASKVTKEELNKFSADLTKQVQTMSGTRTASMDFAETLSELEAQAKKLGPSAVASFNKVKPAMEAAFGRQQAQALRESAAAFGAYLTSLTASAEAAERSVAATLRGRDAVRELAVAEAGANAIRDKGLTGYMAAATAAVAMAAERRKQVAQDDQARGEYIRSTTEQIAAMNAEAAAYEKGGEAVKQYTFKLKFLEAIRNGAKTANEAFEIASAWEQAQDRLDKAKGKIDSVKEAMLEATRGIQRSIAGLIGDAFNGSLKDARAYGQQLIGIFRDIAAQIVAAFAFKKLGINQILEDIGNGQGKFSEFISNGGMLKGKSDLMKGASAALVGGTVGYAVGGMTNSKGVAALGGAASGAAAGAMVAGPIGAVVGGVAGLVGGLLGHAKRMREEQRRIEDATRQFSRSMQDFVESFITPASDFQKGMRSIGESALKLAQEAAAKYTGIKLGTKDTGLTPDQLRGAADRAAMLGAISTGKKAADLMAYANDLRDIANKTEEAMKKMIEAQVKLETGFNQELKARELAAAGRTDEAEAMRLQMAQQRELDDAKLKGFTETTIKELERVQALEASTAALERAKRAEKERADFTTTFWERFASVTGRTDIADMVRADNQRTSDKTMADDLLKRGVIGQEMYDQFIDLINKAFGQALADRAQGYADRSADLDVRMQVATGNQSKADDMAFRLSQERELRDAMKDTSASGIAYANTLKEVQAAETVAREAAKKQRVEDATADLSVRMLSAQGRSAEAEQAAFQLQQQREMREALKDTSAEGIAYAASLKQVQEAEAAAREAAKKRAEVEANMSIDARMLRAQGKTYEADTITTQIARSKEIEEATTEELKARLKLLHTLEDEERARQLAKSNQIDFNSMMVESLQLQGRTAEAAKMEFDFKQIMFREELEQKLINKQITQATFDLGLNLIKLRKTAFDQAQSDALNQTRASEEERSASITEPSPTNSSGSFSYDANAILTSMLIAQRETAYNTGRMAAMAGGGASGTAVNVTVNVSGGSLSGSATEVGNTIGAAVTRQVNEALGRAASTEIRNQGDIS